MLKFKKGMELKLKFIVENEDAFHESDLRSILFDCLYNSEYRSKNGLSEKVRLSWDEDNKDVLELEEKL